MRGNLMLLSNFGNGYPDLLSSLITVPYAVFSYIPSRTELGEVYFNRVKNAYTGIGIREFHYIDIDQNYKEEYDATILSSDIIFLAGGDDPYIIKNLKKRNYDVLLREKYNRGAIVIGLCAGASILSSYTIVSDYDGIKFKDIHVIPWGIGLNKYMYYSRFDASCNVSSLKEFSAKYSKQILAAYLDSVVFFSEGELNTRGKVLLVDGENVSDLQNDKTNN